MNKRWEFVSKNVLKPFIPMMGISSFKQAMPDSKRTSNCEIGCSVTCPITPHLLKIALRCFVFMCKCVLNPNLVALTVTITMNVERSLSLLFHSSSRSLLIFQNESMLVLMPINETGLSMEHYWNTKVGSRSSTITHCSIQISYCNIPCNGGFFNGLIATKIELFFVTCEHYLEALLLLFLSVRSDAALGMPRLVDSC